MTKFKKGDLIESISSLGRFGIGEQFIVVDSRPQLSAPSFHPELVYIEVDGVVRSYSPKHFELVKEGGNNVSRSDVVNAKEVGSSPPKKEFKEGYWYKCVDSAGSVLIAGKYYNVVDTVHKSIFTYLFIKGYGREYSISRFDINSESPYDPTIEVATLKGTSDHIADALSSVVGVTVDKDRKMTVQLQDTLAKVMIDLTKQTEEKQTMSNKTNRRVLNIQLLDNDAGLPVEHALVAEFNGVVTEDNDQTTLQEIISTGEVAERIKVHNEVRSKQLDLAILKSTGQKINLLPIKLKDLTWNIK